MKQLNRLKTLLSLTCLVGSTFAIHAEEDKVDTFIKGIVPEGKVTINSRLRYEGVEQTGKEDANAMTYRLRLGYMTPEESGFQAYIEGEVVTAFNEDDFNAAGRNPSSRHLPIIADPNAQEVNQAWVSYSKDMTSLKVGRQIIALDDQRWVGHVGWRQNIQTYDAATLVVKPADGVTLQYSYLDKVHRIFGDDWPDMAGPTGEFDSNSHILNVGKDTSYGKLTGFIYLVDLENAVALSSATYGVRFAGSVDHDGKKFTYNASVAEQSDYGDNPNDFKAHYFTANAAYVDGPIQMGLGYELLGSDDGVSVKAPLATLHAFNGWADTFLTTPADGLQDLSVTVGYKIPVGKGLVTKLVYHNYKSDLGDVDYGSETDFVAVYKFDKRNTAIFKFSDYHQGDFGTPASRSKISLQWDFVY